MSVKGIILQSRDLEIIRYIRTFPLADSEAIKNKFFCGSTLSTTARRLKKLHDNRLLNRLSPLSEDCYRYYVTKKNCQLAGIEDGNIKRIQRHQLQHDVELYDLLRQLKQNLADEIRIIPDFQLQQYAKRNYRQSFDYKGVVQAGELRFLPDALIKQGKVNIFFEWDRDTIHGINLHRKILAYGAFFQELKNTRANFELNKFRVAFVCPGEKRCRAVASQFEKITNISNIINTVTYSEALSLFEVHK